MSALDLLLSRKALAAGVGLTTRRNKVLPFAGLASAIPARIGRDAPAPTVADVVINGDLYEPPYPAESWAPAWHVDTDKLWSTDGHFYLDKSQWKRWTGRSNSAGDVYLSTSGPLVHFNFSSPATPAALEPLAGGADVQFTERPWALRQWHPLRAAQSHLWGLVGIIQRLKTLTFQVTGAAIAPGGTVVDWSFSDDDSAVSSITAKPAPINQTGTEQGLSTRTTMTVVAPHIRKLNMTISGRQATLRTETPYGFLPAVKEARANAYTSATLANYANDLAKINLIGQPFHGLGGQVGLSNGSYPLRTPQGYQSAPTCNTRYYKRPGLAMPPDPSDPANAGFYPADFIAAGDRFWNDVVLFGGRRYSPSVTTAAMELADAQWFHVDDAGVVRVLRLAFLSRTASTTTWRLWNDGTLLFTPGGPTNALLGEITITTTSAEAIAQYAGTDTTTKVPYQSGQVDVQGFSSSYAAANRNKRANGYVLATTHPVAHSPNGRQIAVFRGLWYKNFSAADKYFQYIDNIHTVATFNIGSDLSISGPTDVFQWVAHWPADRVTTFSYVPSPGLPGWEDELATTTMTPYTDKLCRLIGYHPDGALSLIIEESRVEAQTGTKIVNQLSLPHAARAPMVYPSEVQTDYNMKRKVFTVKGYGADGEGAMVGGVSIGGYASNTVRLANNVLYFVAVDDGSNTTWTDHFITPLAAVARSTVFATPIVGSEARYVSWNPRTNQLGGLETPYLAGDSYTKFISWV